MIYRLRKKFIKICMLSFGAVFLVLFATISLITYLQINEKLDTLADIVAENDGKFPSVSDPLLPADQSLKPKDLNPETPFTTRFFTVRFNFSGKIIDTDIRSIASVTKEEAADYAGQAWDRQKERGWIGDYRYKLYDTENGKAAVFINGLAVKSSKNNFLIASGVVFVIGSLVVLLMVILISKRAIRPVAESYERQKQFITDANHELKTPLTLIRTNLDIMETETGSNEWLSDIREETGIMTEMVNRLVTLAKMDEEQTKLEKKPFNLSDAVEDTASAFSSVIQKSGKEFLARIEPFVELTGDEAAIRQLVAVLMDNAVKYCDPGGTICIGLSGGKHPVLTVENSYAAADSVEFSRLFDRFYRADKARTYGTGFGIGLSIAKAIAERHRGEISALKGEAGRICFRVRF